MKLRTNAAARLAATIAAIALAALTLPAPARAQDKTVLKTNMVRGYVSVYVNGQQVGRYGSKGILKGAPGEGIASVSLVRFVRPGRNTLRLVWSEDKFPVGEIHVSHARAGGAFREITAHSFDVMTKAKGERSVEFNLPGVTSGKQPHPGSGDNQTLLTANITRGNIVVFVNGKKVGSYAQGLVPIDISNYVKGGENSLRLSWNETVFPIGTVGISHAVTKNQFRTIASHDLGVFTKKSGDNNSITFSLPPEAGR